MHFIFYNLTKTETVNIKNDVFFNLSYRINVTKTNITASNWLKHELFLIACKILLRTMDEAAEMCDWATS